jgi:hypothetical protein
MKGVASSISGTVLFYLVEYSDANFSIDNVRRYKIRDEGVAVGNFISHIPHIIIMTGSADIGNVVDKTTKSSLHLSRNTSQRFGHISIKKPSCDGAGVSRKGQVRR